jgi:hypothetical protein
VAADKWHSRGRTSHSVRKRTRSREILAGDRYKGISSVWRHRGTGQLFEVQFHTEISYHAMQLADQGYARLRSARTCAQEEIELEAFQREVYAYVPVPPGADGIPGFPARDIPGKQNMHVTYYAIIDDLSSWERPVSVLRRSYSDSGRRNEAFTQELTWHRSSLLISAERGDLGNEFAEITPDEAARVVGRIRQSVIGSPDGSSPAGSRACRRSRSHCLPAGRSLPRVVVHPWGRHPADRPRINRQNAHS